MADVREQSCASTLGVSLPSNTALRPSTNEIEHVHITAEARSNSFPQKHDKGWKSVSLSPFVGDTT